MKRDAIGRIGLVLTFGLTAFLPGACRHSPDTGNPPAALSQRVTWEGRGPANYSVTAVSGVDSQSSQAAFRVHTFEFAGSETTRLTLEEFGHAYSAFAAFQERASASELADGCILLGNDLTFRHGPFLGRVRYKGAGLVPSRFLKESLVFRNEPLFAPPPEFESFPLLGRIPHSERIVSSDFLGRNWRGPVFTVAYRCHDDTATAFRAYAQNPADVNPWLREWAGTVDTLNRGREFHFQGWDEFHQPLIFWFYKDAVMGFIGCFDPILGQDYAQKMEKTRVFWDKP